MTKVCIYGLKDPRTNEIRYVGKTQRSVEKRLQEHCRRTDNNPFYGMHHTDETKALMSVAHKKRYEDPAVREQQSNSQKGRRHSEATKAKMRKSRLEYYARKRELNAQSD